MPAQSRIVIKKLKIQEVPLKNHFGFAFKDEYRIEIAPCKNGRSLMSTYAHEIAHLILPDASETKIKQIAAIFTKALWGAGFRLTKK